MSDGNCELNLVPLPVRCERTAGAFRAPADLAVGFGPGDGLERVAVYLAGRLEVASGRRPRVVWGSEAERAAIRLLADLPAKEAGREGYRLSVAPGGVALRAAGAEGLFRAATTLLQLVPDSGSLEALPCVEVEDRPRFAWRGLMLDVCRYFYPKADILKFLDMMALHKLNVFHWHLTEDQGWRLESRAYPRLTAVAAWRRRTRFGHHRNGAGFDGVPHGGFYTRQDVREIVAHAAERFITVVPEIEMPGHAQAAIAAYPELGCVAEPLEVSCDWGVHKNVFNPGKEETFAFLETVLGEALELFPSEFIHIGGDECPKDQWKTNALCQERIRAEGLKDEDELQSWFIRRIERFLNSRGRRLIGWDEILEGGLAPNATVMSWRGEEGGVAAARAGHDVVMTPNKHVYFDYYQGGPQAEPLAIGGMLPLEKVYEYEPVPKELTEAEAAHVLGAQGNLWTEYMPTFRHVEYMTLPRAAALAEVAWSPRESRDLAGFKARLGGMLARYRTMDWTYRPPKD